MENKLTGGETKLLWKGPGFGQGWDVIVSGLLMLCEQDTERGRQSSINTLLAEVSERAYPKPSREEADRLKQEVSLLPHSPRLSCSDYPQVLISPVMGMSSMMQWRTLLFINLLRGAWNLLYAALQISFQALLGRL